MAPPGHISLASGCVSVWEAKCFPASLSSSKPLNTQVEIQYHHECDEELYGCAPWGGTALGPGRHRGTQPVPVQMQVPSIDPNADDAINMQQLLGWMLAIIVYNLFFHPLCNIPGPLLHRASIIPWSIQILRGIQMFETQKMHDRYGPVVRLSPNHVAFTDPRAWKGIYSTLVGHKSGMTELPVPCLRPSPRRHRHPDHQPRPRRAHQDPACPSQ